MTDKPSIASARRGAYAAAMVGLRLVQLLALVALILAPVGMASGHAAAMAATTPHHAMAMPSDHCAGMDQPAGHQPAKEQPPSCIDCTMVCSALPAADGAIAVHPFAAAALPRIPLEDAVQGLHPESDPPPPRLA